MDTLPDIIIRCIFSHINDQLDLMCSYGQSTTSNLDWSVDVHHCKSNNPTASNNNESIPGISLTYARREIDPQILHNKRPSYLLFADSFDASITHGQLPNTLIKIRFGNSFAQPIVPGVLPASLVHLEFHMGSRFNHPFGEGVLPPSLRTLKLGMLYNMVLTKGSLPPSLSSLTFGYGYDQPFEPGVLPASITSLTFGHSYNQSILPDVLPQSLTSLKFGNNYNQPLLHGSMPLGLKSIVMGSRYNQPFIGDEFPDGTSLTELTLGLGYMQPAEHVVLPSTLKTLNLQLYAIHSTYLQCLPSSVERVGFNDPFPPVNDNAQQHMAIVLNHTLHEMDLTVLFPFIGNTDLLAKLLNKLINAFKNVQTFNVMAIHKADCRMIKYKLRMIDQVRALYRVQTKSSANPQDISLAKQLVSFAHRVVNSITNQIND
ncbi:hypothetical protein SAMD00019534_082490 [Acytostelium subglobosum LB1]|uniref:hypothetical protein n=1 Tax=Acytostelium subglobosum LB1 TaxID=1410327 RepID=UPI000644A9A7|nr:hypothetical protein SAMD00019534_082490 [Acytostelium subglobosum LB1]GAM25074.1 hypothetical protein SAMD00019534_082490 [Acytostelium subglobosum LB1]|eukprot:XP_012752163.1 hypothetical protein SAMD00019534_082490 [Acytostelium subglobosum LB1]